jgi:deazaflavin-dependent oxidoreductase (nitroreductase family)
MWRLHRFWWRVSGGRVGTHVAGLPVLELITSGRTSGKPRSVLLTYIDDPLGPVVIASNAGSDRPPDWFRNLEAQPLARIRRAGRITPVRARRLDGGERERAWEAAVRANPRYEGYRAATSRTIPVVHLDVGLASARPGGGERAR